MSMSLSKILSRGHKLLGNEMTSKYFINASRTLLDPAVLDIDQYVKNREITKKYHSSLEEVFRKRARQDLNSEAITSSDSLRTMMHLVENKPEDLDLLVGMIKKYHGRNQWKLGTPINGTVAMRAFYFLNQPKVALEVFKDPNLEVFFDQLSSYEILLDLLFNNGMYKEVIDTFDAIKDKLKKQLVPSIIVFGACYKLNTPESFQYALDLFMKLQEKGLPNFNKNLSFLSVLALFQGKPDVALETMALHTLPRSIIYRNIAVLANAHLHRWTDVELSLTEALTDVTPTFKRKFFKEVLDGIETKLNGEHKNIGDMVKELREGGFLHELTLDEYLCTKIRIGSKSGNRGSNENSNQQRFRRQNSNTTSQNRQKAAENLKKFSEMV